MKDNYYLGFLLIKMFYKYQIKIINYYIQKCMNKFYFLIIVLLITFQVQAQFTQKTPWNKNNKKELTLKEISNSFNAYWDKNQDKKDEKGSGYKPFKRWENRWKLELDKSGHLLPPKKLWEHWEAKNKLQKNSTNTSDWQPVGPFTQESKSGQGRVNTFIVDPNNPNTYYVGAPAGGIWKSTDSGTTWTPLSDYLPQIGVSGIAIDPTNSNIIYIATGDDDAGDSYSIGVLKSIDGGLTWNPTGLQFFSSGNTSNEIYIHPTNPNILWVATSQGLYKTTNGGTTWLNKLNGDIKDLKLKPNNPDIIYATSTSSFYKSIDGGENFTQISNGLPAFSNRLLIDVTPANENLVLALSTDGSGMFQGVYKSTDSGNNFVRTNEFDDILNSGQTWFNLALTVSETDENIVFVGALDVWKSTDGGDDFIKINSWFLPSQSTYTHADIHFLRYFNGNLYCGSDGGIYKSTNDGNSFDELNEGLAISQFYRIANARQSSDNISGGLQDNGGFGYSNNIWYQYHGGDGMDCAVDPSNPNIYYGFTQFGGSLNKTTNGGITGFGITAAPEAGNWITPLTMNKDGELYAGFSRLYKLNDNQQWQQISGNVFEGRLHRLEIDNNDTNTIFVSRLDKLYKSTDKGITFTQIPNFTDDFISSIEINNNDSNIIYITTSSGEDGKVLKSTDGGITFTDITANLPSESKLIVKHVPHNPENDIYVGTTLGVYHINDNMTNWETFSNNLPNVQIRDLEINISDAKIIAATYGRSIWETSINIYTPTDNIRLVEINNPTSNVNCSDTITPEITVKNGGQNTINQVDVNYTINTTNYNFTYNGSIEPQTTQIITLPSISGLNLGEHHFQASVNITNDAYNEDNNSSNFFHINQSDNNPSTINPFESSANQWLTVDNTNSWQIGTPLTPILGSAGNTGYVTTLNANYPDNSISYLNSPCYDLTSYSSAILKFDMLFSLETDYDVLYVEYTTNQGNTWQVLGTADDPNWYNSSFDQNVLTIGKQWTGTNSTLKEYSHDVTFLTNQNNVSFRFTFLTDQSVTSEGVLIDNFRIETVASTTTNILENISVYPNPSNGIITIQRSSNEKMNFSIFDITGKQIHSQKNITDNLYTINLSNITKGVYFINISVNDKIITKKLIKL